MRGNVTPQLGNSQRALPPGFSVQIVPLRYVGVREMLRILEPFAKDASAVRAGRAAQPADPVRHRARAAAPDRNDRHVRHRLDGRHVGGRVHAAERRRQDGDGGARQGDRRPATSPLAGILRIIPIERMNALLVITPQPAYLEEAKKWIERLDKGGTRRRRRASTSTTCRTSAPRSSGRCCSRRSPAARAAGGRGRRADARAGHAGGHDRHPADVPAAADGAAADDHRQHAPPAPQPRRSRRRRRRAGARAATALGIVRNLQVVADKDNNTLLIVATPPEYSVIEAALKKLDVPQRQVVIEVTIAEVTLTDELEFGVEWLFKGGAPSGRGAAATSPAARRRSIRRCRCAAAGAPPPSIRRSRSRKGFNYIINNANFPGGIQAALHLLDTYGNTKVIANPHLAALDNQKATIKAGDRIPINQQTHRRRHDQRRHDDVAVHRHRRAAAGDAAHQRRRARHARRAGRGQQSRQRRDSPCDAPPINTRSVQTLVAVPTGQTMVMGGLISETKQNTSRGPAAAVAHPGPGRAVRQPGR